MIRFEALCPVGRGCATGLETMKVFGYLGTFDTVDEALDVLRSHLPTHAANGVIVVERVGAAA